MVLTVGIVVVNGGVTESVPSVSVVAFVTIGRFVDKSIIPFSASSEFSLAPDNVTEVGPDCGGGV